MRFDFLKLETGHLFFFLGAGSDFFQQLKLDIFRDLVKEFIFLTIKVFFTIAISA